MGRVFAAVFVIFGTVVGSGFSSGKEIFVYFSRFGLVSFLNIFIACLLFFFLFRFALKYGEKLSRIIKNNKFISVANGFASTIFCASMLSGLSNLFSYFPSIFKWICMIFVVISCLFVVHKGMGSLEKINSTLMPIVAILFFIVLLSFLSGVEFFESSFFGVVYAPLYVALNTSMNMLVLSELGKEMSKKQVNWTCFLSVMMIFLFLMLGNFVLGSASSETEMPFLSIAEDNFVTFFVMFLIILSGCFTTLISLCYTLNSSLCSVIKNRTLCALVSVFLPLAISALGFSEIVTILYPICSMLGVFVLAYLLIKTFFLDGG